MKLNKIKNLFNTHTYRARIFPAGIIIIALIIAGSISITLAPRPIIQNLHAKKTVEAQPTTAPSPTPENDVLGTSTQTFIPTPTPIKTASNTNSNTSSTSSNNSNNASSNNNTNNSTNDSPTPIPTSNNTNSNPTPTPTTSASSTPTPTPAQTQNMVNMEINDPDGDNSFQVKLNGGANACDVLQESKDEGKINSLTFNDAYMSTLHSRYVTEINGFQNNWTFTINGSSPNGCSLINPQPNDHIVWKFN